MLQCVGHKRGNVPQREGLSVPQHHAAVGPGHPSMPSAPFTVSPPSVSKTLQAVKLYPQTMYLPLQCNAMCYFKGGLTRLGLTCDRNEIEMCGFMCLTYCFLRL